MRYWRQSGAIAFLVAILTLSGALEPLERGLLSFRFALDHRQASGDVVVVQIDAQSIRDLGIWPFQRAQHALLLDRLREAGAGSIAFDVELTEARDKADNDLLVAALQRAGGQVILPSFMQLASAGQKTGQIIRTEPAKMFADHGWLANVNVFPSSDGRIWTMTYGDWVDGTFQYSLAATLAGRAVREEHGFYVDYGIQISSIPRLSFVDVLEGRFQPEDIAGKSVIIGATAVELGDQLNLPVVGVVSGPVLQALAFETIHQSREIERTSFVASIILALIVLVALNVLRTKLHLALFVATCIGVIATAQLVAFVLQSQFAVSADTGCVLLVSGLSMFAQMIQELDRRRTETARERREKEGRGRMFDQIIDDSFDGIVIMGEAGRIESINQVACRSFGLDPSRTYVGESVFSVLPKWHAKDGPIWEQLTPDRFGERLEVEIEHPLEGTRIYECVATQSKIHETSNQHVREYFTITFRDVTDRRRIELERDEALQASVAANRAKTEFLANMSHELRTPLNAIIGFSEIMSQQVFGPLGSERYAGYAEDIHGSGRHLLSIVNDILDVARVEVNDFTLNEEEINVYETALSVQRLAEGWPATMRREVVIDICEDIPPLWADRRLFKQMLLNLVSNASKFSDTGDTVTVQFKLDAAGGLVVHVVDEGIGIPADSLVKLTTAFYQVDSALERRFEGTGLGLTLVQKHMELHGGTVSFESEVGVGTTVTLTFPPDRTRTSDLEKISI
ncbi:MAG: CHASE2 domain-containing protein [Parvibaculum sp.]